MVKNCVSVLNDTEKVKGGVNVGVYQGLVMRPILYIIKFEEFI